VSQISVEREDKSMSTALRPFVFRIALRRVRGLEHTIVALTNH
jgi:hypothetical protein